MNKDDELDLPSRPQQIVVERSEKQKGISLTEDQVNRVIDIGGKAIVDIGEIAKSLVEIHHMRAKGEVAKELIEAETQAYVVRIRAQIEQMKAEQGNIRERGDAIVAVIDAVTRALEWIPDLDTQSRNDLINKLPELAESAVKQK